MMQILKFQIGKNGLTKGTIDSLKLGLKNHNQIRVAVLKSAMRDRDKMSDIAERIKKELNNSCDSRIIGFTIILIRKIPKKK